MRFWVTLPRSRSEEGFVLPLILLVLMVVGMMGATLLFAIQTNQHHVSRDRAYSQSLAVAEAGLNQYLWMVAAGKSSEYNDFAIFGNPGPDPHKQTIQLTDAHADVKGTYTLLVTPPSGNDSRITVTITGKADSPVEVPRTVRAHIGRPSFSEYLLLVDDTVNIAGPLDRVWWGKTHSNSGIRIDTANIIDMVTCAREKHKDNSSKGGVWSDVVPGNDPSRAYWSYPVPPIDFDTVVSDFVKLYGKATGIHRLDYVSTAPPGAAHGWYIKLLPNKRYQVAQVTGELESRTYDPSNNNNHYGGYLTYGTLSAVRDYPSNGVIYVNDNVWVEGADLDGRLTIACSGQMNEPGKRDITSINIVGDLTYSAKDGTVAIGLIAQNNVKIPMYAPMGRSGNPSQMDMEVDAAMIAQQGASYVSRDSSGSASSWGPRRNQLTYYGARCSFAEPTRISSSGSHYCGFYSAVTMYDQFMLYNPPPFFPTIGSYQILDWQELPGTQAVAP